MEMNQPFDLSALTAIFFTSENITKESLQIHNWNVLNQSFISELFISLHDLNILLQFDSRYLEIIRLLWLYGGPCIFTVGILGNILSALVMLRKALRQNVTSLYLVLLAVVDSCILCVTIPECYFQNVHGKPYFVNSVQCKIFGFFKNSLLIYESWILVALTVERACSIFAPFKAKTIFTKKFAAAQLGLIGILALGINLHTLFQMAYDDDMKCMMVSSYFYNNVWPWILNVAICLAPFTIIIATNIAIIVKLVYLHQKRKRTQSVSNNARLAHTTTMLLAVGFAFILTIGPMYLFLCIQWIWFDQLSNRSIDELEIDEWAIMEFVESIFTFLSLFNNSFNFFLYCLSSSKFRNEFFKMIHIKRSKVSPGN